MPAPLIVETDGALRVLTLNWPEARNALSGDLVRALYRALVEADAEEAVRVVILTGSDPAFCAGVDLKEAARDGAAYFAQYDGANCIAQVAQVRKPVLGAVNGAAFTGGLELALGCDFLLASERAVFADTHARVGVLPGGGMTARLPRIVGAANARRMSMTGEVVDAGSALRMGLVSEVVPHERLLPRTVELAHRIAAIDPASLRAVKHMYVDGATETLAALDIETSIARATRTDYDGLERRRREVLEHNRAQLRAPAGGGAPDPPAPT